MLSLLDPRLWLAGMAVAGMAAGGGYLLGGLHKERAIQAQALEQIKHAQELARLAARDAAQYREKKDAEVRKINARLVDALERLRQRPERLPEPARAACTGATGAELSGPDAGFLVREAARADELRAALAECYGWIDAVTR